MNTKPLQLKNLAKKHKPRETWSQEARIQAVSQYLVLGNLKLVSGITGIGHQLLRNWKCEPWWAEMEAQIRATQNLELDGKLSKIVDRSLDAVMDRLENGEFVYNQKTGQVVRKQVNMKDAAKVSVDLLSKRELLRGNATERKETTQLSVADQLKQLAAEFAKWQSPQKKIETIDLPMVEVLDKDEDDAIHEERETRLQEGTELGTHESSEPGEGSDGTQLSSFDDGESGESSQG